MSNVIHVDFDRKSNKTDFTIETLESVAWNVLVIVYKDKKSFYKEKGQPEYECSQFGVSYKIENSEEGRLVREVYFWYQSPSDFVFAFNFLAFVLLLADLRAKELPYIDFVHAMTSVGCQIEQMLKDEEFKDD